jgi:CubicO group peptidase (beta-lactamase class C family)
MRAQSIVTTILIVATPTMAIAQQPTLARIDSVVRAEMSRQRIPGVAVAVVKGGTVMLSKGYGESNIEHHVP